MTFNDKLDAIEQDSRSHRARILLLLLAYGRHDSGNSLNLVRLAYLDYFLRYPTSLERALYSKGNKGTKLRVREFERESLEGKLGALRVAPWDSEYRLWLAAEFAAGRIAGTLKDDDFTVELTERGRAAAEALQEADPFKIVYARAEIIVKNFDQQTPTLRNAIARCIPETVNQLMVEVR